MAHNPKCQHSSCHRTANDYDQRFGQLVFFCNTTTQSHDPRIMDQNNRKDFTLDQVDVVCDECDSVFAIDGLDEETLEDVACEVCGHEDKLLVTQ